MDLEERTVSYAQNREDVILAAFFPDINRGFYVDIGAHHPTDGSVTKYFYNKGWRGINVEPNKRLFRLLAQERADDTNVNMGITDKEGELVFREYPNGDGLSTFSKETQELHKKNGTRFTENFVDYPVPVITLKKLFDTNRVGNIQFMKVDVEGLEHEVLSSNDWEKYRPEVVCVESIHVFKNWATILEKEGYKLAFNDGLNDYYTSSDDRARTFSYVRYALGENIIYYKDYDKFLQDRNSLRAFKQEIIARDAQERELIREIVYRDTLLQDSARFRNAFISLITAINRIIMIQINRLNHPKRKHASRNIEIKDDLDKLSVKDLLYIARIIDFQNYYTLDKGSGSFQGQYLYKTILFSYTMLKKLIKLPLKVTWRTLRLVRRIGRKT